MAIDTEKELFEIKKLAVENNQILKKLQRKSRLGTVFSIIRWTIIAFIAFGVYTFVQPIVGKFMESYDVVVDSAVKIKEIREGVPGFNFKDIFGGGETQ